MRQDPITIVDHDPAWARSFRDQRDRIQPVLAARLIGPIEHMGSTAVPGLPAKPIIDMLARVDDYAACAEVFDALAALDWVVAPEPGDAESRHWSLCHPTAEYRTHHLHIVEHASTDWPVWLAFRDHLRECAADRDEYARIKRGLADADDRDRARYRSRKAPFITKVLSTLERKRTCS